MEERSQEEIEWHMERFIELIQKCQDSVHQDPRVADCTVVVKKGRKYWKILTVTCRTYCIFGFVRREDGAIFRAANMKAPETRTKNPIRGYIWEPNVEDTFTWTGIIYDQTG